MAKASVVRRARARLHGSANPNFRGGFKSRCDQCHAAIWIRPSRKRFKRHFCGVACRNAAFSATRGASTSNFRGGPVTVSCAVCSVPFQVSRAERARGFGKCCSRTCHFKTTRTPVEVTCKHCGKAFTISPCLIGKAKFCSRPCQYAAKRKVRTPREIAQRKLEVRIASLMGYSLKGRKAGCKWESLVGYTLRDLMAHLESKFSAGMSWLNIGEWHIDHRRPRSVFVYDSPTDPEFQACWALANLQPLWAVDNMTKGARLDWQSTLSVTVSVAKR